MSATTRYPASFAARLPIALALASTMTLAAAILGASGAIAAPAPTKISDDSAQAQVRPSLAVETTEDQANCSRNRRRLWVDGEGWIVRRITTCR